MCMMIHLTTFHLLVLVSLAVLIHTVCSLAIPDGLPKEIRNESTSTQVSWYSIFWALFVLAINSMSQPSLLDKHISPSNLLFPSHSSPIACLVDAGDVILDLSIRIIFGGKIRQAAAEVLWRRARDRMGATITMVEETIPEKFPITTAILFIGPLSQAIKIYGCEGILWAKVLASMYLSSYFVLTIAAVLAPSDWRSKPATSRNMYTSQSLVEDSLYDQLSMIVILILLSAQPLLYFWFLEGVIRRSIDLQEKQPEIPTVLTVVYEIIMILPALSIWIVGFSFIFFILLLVLIASCAMIIGVLPAPGITVRLYYLAVLCLVVQGVTAVYRLFYRQLTFFDVLVQSTQVIIHFGWYSVGFFVILVVVAVVIDSRAWIYRRVPFLRPWGQRGSTIWLVVFAAVNIGILLLYLVKGYDSTGTVKPAWTDRLG